MAQIKTHPPKPNYQMTMGSTSRKILTIEWGATSLKIDEVPEGNCPVPGCAPVLSNPMYGPSLCPVQPVPMPQSNVRYQPYPIAPVMPVQPVAPTIPVIPPVAAPMQSPGRSAMIAGQPRQMTSEERRQRELKLARMNRMNRNKQPIFIDLTKTDDSDVLKRCEDNRKQIQRYVSSKEAVAKVRRRGEANQINYRTGNSSDGQWYHPNSNVQHAPVVPKPAINYATLPHVKNNEQLMQSVNSQVKLPSNPSTIPAESVSGVTKGSKSMAPYVDTVLAYFKSPFENNVSTQANKEQHEATNVTKCKPSEFSIQDSPVDICDKVYKPVTKEFGPSDFEGGKNLTLSACMQNIVNNSFQNFPPNEKVQQPVITENDQTDNTFSENQDHIFQYENDDLEYLKHNGDNSAFALDLTISKAS